MERRHLLRVLTAGTAVGAAALVGRTWRGAAVPGRVTTPTAAGAGPAERPTPPRAATETDSGAPASDSPADVAPADRSEASVTTPAAIAVLCREATGLVAAREGGRPHRITTMTLHHSAVRHERAAEAPGRMRGHQRHHLAQGWPDVAYHYGVDLAGNVYELRDVGLAGDTFTEYDPAGHFLVVCEGDYDQQRPTEAMLQAVAGLFAHASRRFDVPVDAIAGHRDRARTRCPGDGLIAALPAIRDEAARQVTDGATGIVRLCGAEAKARIAGIEAA